MWPLRRVSPPLSTVHATLERQRDASLLNWISSGSCLHSKKICLFVFFHPKSFFFLLILRFTHWSQKLGYKNMTMEIHGFFKSSTELVDGSSTRELFSFHAFEQMGNLFTDKRRRYRANEQQAARPRFTLSLLAASCKLLPFVWRGWATTQPSSTEKQFGNTEST